MVQRQIEERTELYSGVCVLAMWVGIDPATPLVVAANRDELLARPSAPPGEIEPGIVGGRDLVRGGTWLGVRRDGLFVAILNRRTPAWTPDCGSRGLLALDALRCTALQEVEDVVAGRVASGSFAGFNLVAVSRGEGISIHYDGAPRRQSFGAGRHVISSDSDLDDPRMPEKSTFDRFVERHAGVPDDPSLHEFLASHEGERPICKHGAEFGTVSSTIVRVYRDGGSSMHYATGAPCVTSFREVGA